jgi:arylsulfatase A-like enzyme
MNRPMRCLLLAAVLAGSSALVLAATRPNIVVLVADDWGFTDVGAYGGEIATPHLDALARTGTRFSNFHVAASCAPTRSMLLTGVDNHRNGVGNLRETMPQAHLGQPGYQGSLTPRVVTVASLLQDGGYRTMIAGKWNVGSEPYNLPHRAASTVDRAGRHRLRQLGAGQALPAAFGQRRLVRERPDGEDARRVLFLDLFRRPHDRLSAQGRAGSGKPFFAYVGFQANHVPLQAPRAFIDKYRGRYQDGWTALRQQRRDRAAALGLIPKDTPLAVMPTTRDWDALSDKEKRYEARRMEVYAGMADAMDHRSAGWWRTCARAANSTTRCSCSCPTTAPRARTTPMPRSGWPPSTPRTSTGSAARAPTASWARAGPARRRRPCRPTSSMPARAACGCR